ncbi:MAG: PQQ-binding-like beta-propeller repeat protein [Bacteroidales bacterium]|nr:PQQ-binding-like beta-propeller repeat protein [Bacteroidales bacterium]
MKVTGCVFLFYYTLVTFFVSGQNLIPDSLKSSPKEFEVIIPTFLGNEQRNYYGNYAPDTLEVIWKHYLGKGETIISRKLGSRIWAGAGWTGQPLLVREDSMLYLIQGSYDHHLKKLNARTGELVWQYKFDDVVKGTGTIWTTPDTFPPENRLIILQGSRLGVGNYLDTKYIPSYRAISYFSGKELWRLDVKWMKESYSRDADGSALILNDTVYIGLENSLFTVLNPSPSKASVKNGMLQPEIIQETPLFTKQDAIDHKLNCVTESSPSLLDSIIYIASGAGHIYGYSLKEKKLVWDFFIGSDMDGSVVVTSDNCLLVSVEKQYIKGQGGAFKLNPAKAPENAVIWYFPTENTEYASWEGGIIGTIGINDRYNKGNTPYMAAFNAIDGYLYVVDHTKIDSSKTVLGPDSISVLPTPQLLFKYKTGASVSTPLILENKIIAAGYGGIYLFGYNKDMEFRKIARLRAPFESTPIVHNGKIYIASRDGYFYCLGKKL